MDSINPRRIFRIAGRSILRGRGSGNSRYIFKIQPGSNQVGTTSTKMEKDAEPSSRVTDYSFSGYDQVIRPEVDFGYSFEIYKTVGKVQNGVESYVTEILSRDWYYVDKDLEAKKAKQQKLLAKKVKQLKGQQQQQLFLNAPGQQQEAVLAEEVARLTYEQDQMDNSDSPDVQRMNDWEEQVNLSRLMEYWVRDLLTCGNSITGTSDWQPVQMDSMVGMKRDEFGNVIQYVQQSNGKWYALPLDVKDYIHIKYIEMGRKPWGLGLYHSLLTTFTDANGDTSIPELEVYRRHIQNVAKIETKYASPVVVWAYDNVDQRTYNQLREQLDNMQPGDRRITTRKPELITETIDSRSGLIAAITPIIDKEIEAGLQTSANRLLTEPSAMADAREANKKDDARLLGMMEKLRRIMNKEVIPRVLGADANVEFMWGTQDDFEIDMPPGVAQAIQLGVIAKDEAREILKSRGWKLDDNAWAEETNMRQQMSVQRMQALQQQRGGGGGGGFPRGPRNGAASDGETGTGPATGAASGEKQELSRIRIETARAKLAAAQEKAEAAKLLRKRAEKLRGDKVD